MPALPRLLSGLIFCAAAMQTGAAAADTTRIFGDWTATCWTRDARCAAETDAIVRKPYRVTLSVARANGKEAAWEAGLRLRDVRVADGAMISLRFGGAPAMTFPASGYTRHHGGGRIAFSGRGEAAAVIRSLAASAQAHVAFAAPRRGKVARDFYISGLSGALAWINARQGRDDSVTAQLAPPPAARPETVQPPAKPDKPDRTQTARAETGPAPATDTDKDNTIVAANEAAGDAPATADAATPAPAAETAQAIQDGKPAPAAPDEAAPQSVLQAMIERHQRKSECEEYGSGALAGLEARSAQLTGGKVLYLVPCFASGGTVASRLYVARGEDAETARTLYFANFSPSLGWYGSDTLIDAAYDAETGLLTAGGTGSGKGCGNAARYRWDGFDFRLLEYRASDDCDGPADPSAWPVIYEASPRAEKSQGLDPGATPAGHSLAGIAAGKHKRPGSTRPPGL